MEDDVDAVQRALPVAAVADISLKNSAWDGIQVVCRGDGSAVRVVEDSHIPPGGQRRIDDVRADQPAPPVTSAVVIAAVADLRAGGALASRALRRHTCRPAASLRACRDSPVPSPVREVIR